MPTQVTLWRESKLSGETSVYLLGCRLADFYHKKFIAGSRSGLRRRSAHFKSGRRDKTKAGSTPAKAGRNIFIFRSPVEVEKADRSCDRFTY
jgi:hypothetical protein